MIRVRRDIATDSDDQLQCRNRSPIVLSVEPELTRSPVCFLERVGACGVSKRIRSSTLVIQKLSDRTVRICTECIGDEKVTERKQIHFRTERERMLNQVPR